MKNRCTVALSGAIFLLFLSHVGGDALKDESGEDDLKTPLPLVVSIPSKVFRANRLNANDVIGVMPTLDTEKVEFTHFVTTRRPKSTTTTSVASEESTIATSTTTTPSPTTEITTTPTTTTTTELTTTTTEKETIANVTKEIEVNNNTNSGSTIESRNEAIELENNSTSVDDETDSFHDVTTRATTTTTTELTTPSTTTVTTTTSATTTTTSANEEVAEKDYGQALGFDLEPELDEHPTFSSDSQDDGMSVVSAVTNESEIEETTSDEIDPFDVAAQASEVDYAVIASEDHQSGISHNKQEMRRNESVVYDNEEEESLEERDEEHSNLTLSNVNFSEKRNETHENNEDDDNNNNKKQSFVSTNALYNLNTKFLSKDDPQKDLLPAASSVNSPTVVGPEAQMDDLSGHVYEDIVPTAEASSAVQKEAVPTATDPEYEYIYEYVDLNTTDIPSDLPEGVIILTGDQRLPIVSTAKPIEVSTESRLTNIDDHHSVLEAKSNDTIVEEQPLLHDYEEFHPLDGNTKTNDDLKSFTGDDLKSYTSDGLKSFTSDDQKSFTNSEFVTEPATAAADPFVPNFPQSPVYFVGLQRETLPPSDESSGPDSFVSAQTTTTERPKSLRGDSQSDPNVQLNTLYALSRALPINDNVPFLIEDGELENTTILLPPDLPDPFSDELLGSSVGIQQSTTEEFFATATTELPTTSTEPSTTTTPTTTTEEPTTTTTEATTTTTTEEPTTSASRATRPGSRRRTTSTSAAPEASSVEQATTATSGNRQRGQRVGGRRRPTTSTAAPSGNVNGGTTNFTLTEKTRTGQRNRRPVLSRTRTTTAGSNIEEAASNDSTGDKNGATNDNSISGSNGVKRPGSSRRTVSRPSSNGGTNGSENSETGSTIPQRPTRARRPAINRNGNKLNKEGSISKASSNETSSDKKGGEEAATRKPLFRPRNRSRFNLRNKAEAASTTTTTTTEHHSPSEEAALTTAEHVEGEHTVEEASGAPLEKAGSGNEEKAIVTEAPAPSGGEHSRKFPPRTRPGARATIRHSQS